MIVRNVTTQAWTLEKGRPSLRRWKVDWAAAKTLLGLLALLLGGTVYADDCDYYSALTCPTPPLCQSGDNSCSLTPGSSATPNLPGGGTQSSPGLAPPSVTADHVILPSTATRKALALSATESAEINSLTQQPSPGLNNVIVITNAGPHGSAGIISNDGRLITLQASATPRLPARLPDTEPVAGDGEFVVDETDISLPGTGIPFVFSRHYRSGADYQTPMGFGWNHTYNQRLVIADAAYTPPAGVTAPPPDVFLLNDRLEQLRFAFSNTSSDGVDTYSLQSPGVMILKRQHGATGARWRLDDGSGLTYLFDGNNGELVSIADAAGHAITVYWKQGSGAVAPLVNFVVDTTGRYIYFNYQYVDQKAFWTPGNITWTYSEWSSIDNGLSVDENASVGPQGYQYLACLSLSPDPTCGQPMVSFKVNPVTATNQEADYLIVTLPNGAHAGYQSVNYTYEFDLVQVLDSTGHGPTYKYYPYTDYYGDPRLYQKEFDTYWPSQYARDLYEFFQTQIPALEAMCPYSAQDAANVAATLHPENSLCQTSDPQFVSCIASEVSDLTKSCIKNMPKAVKGLTSRYGPPNTFEYGVPPQLAHNLVEIDDADGRVVVQNTYGTNPALPDFDRVNHQTLGGDSTKATTFMYLPLGGADGKLIQFNPVNICQPSGPSYGPLVTQSGLPGNQYQFPSWEVISNGPLGRTSTIYIDPDGQILRSVDTAGATTNYNYSPWGPAGVLQRNGQRVCFQYDNAGRVSAATELPAPGLSGDTIKTALSYDGAEALTRVTQTIDSGTLADRSIARDEAERVIGIGDAVDAGTTRWTCYQYTDVSAGVLPRLQARVALNTRGQSPDGSLSPSTPVTPPRIVFPPCAYVQTAALNVRRAAIPSRITKPDATVITLGNMTPTGPGEIVVDAAGAAPLDRYFTYDSWGRVNETGLRDYVTKQVVPESIKKWTTSLEGLLGEEDTPDPTNPSQFVATTYLYDNSRNPKSIADPLLVRAFTTDVFGNVTSVNEIPQGGALAPGTLRWSCVKYNAYSQPTTTISPEGVVSEFAYDPVGNVTSVTMSSLTVPVAPNPLCVAGPVSRSASGGPSHKEIVAQFAYNSIAQLTASMQNGVSAQYAYDGFGRLVDTSIVSPGRRSSGAIGTSSFFSIGEHHSVGYRGRNVAWTVIANTFPAGGVLPSYLTSGVHAATEYSYDWVGRPVQIKEWAFIESPSLAAEANPYWTESIVYDDAKNSVQVTDPNNVISFLARDGADRELRFSQAMGAAEEVDHVYSYSQAGLVRTTLTTPAPTNTGTFTRVESFSPRGTLLQDQAQGQTVFQRTLDSFGRVATEQTPSDGLLAYSMDAFGQPLTVQQSLMGGAPTTVAKMTWNGDGHLSSMVDGAQHSTIYDYDFMGRLQSVTSGLGKTAYQYSTGTTLPSVVTNPGGVITMTYDPHGWPSTETIADSQGRDPSGNRSFGYSPLGGMSTASVTRSGQATETVQLMFDSLGRRIGESDNRSSFSLSRTYGVRSEQVTIAGAWTSTIVSRQFDSLYRPSALQVNGQAVAQYQYAHGAPSTIAYAGGTSLAYGYDSLARMITANVTQGPTAIAGFAQSFGADNLPHQRTVMVGSTAVETDVFQTDESGRIAAEQALSPGLQGRPNSFGNSDAATAMTAARTQYVLDGAGNWQSRSGPNAMTTAIDNANRYTQINGAAVQNITGGGISSYLAQQFRYDGLDELTYAAGGTGSKQRLYDAIGRPSIETDGQGNASQLIWDGSILIGTSPLGTTPALSLRAGFSSQGTLAVVNPDASSALLFHAPDDSVFAAASNSGTLLQAYAYGAYGDPHVWTPAGTSVASSAAISPELFQGAIYDPSLALYHMGVRPYSASLGRFLSPDPMGQLGGLNLFAFVGDRPLSYADPTGTNGRPSQGNGRGPGSGSWHPGLWDQAISYVPTDQSLEDIATGVARGLGGPLEFVGNVLASSPASKWGAFSRGLDNVYGGDTVNRRSDQYVMGRIVGTLPHFFIGAFGSIQGYFGAAEAVTAAGAGGAGSNLGVTADTAATDATQFYIENGVRRSLAAQQSGLSEIPATIYQEGQAPINTSVNLNQLFSPKATIPLDQRFLNIQPPIQVPIQIQPLGLPGQLPTVPLSQVRIVPP